MSDSDDITDHVSKGGKMPGPDWKSLSEIVKQASDSDRLSKLQRVASEQLATLVLSIYSTDWSPSLEDADFIPDASGNWGKASNGMWGSGGTCGSGYRLVTTYEQRVARMAVKYAKALLEMTE